MSYVRNLGWMRTALAACLLAAGGAWAQADETKKFELGEGAYSLPIPEGWLKTQPRSRIVEFEFEIKPAAGDEVAGRATVMAAGGSIEDNIKRWVGQFVQPDGSNTEDKAKVSKSTVAGQDVHWVDIGGTYMDKPGPFVPGPGTPRPNYRMLGAIIQTQRAGNYFVKFYGPEKTITQQEPAFKKMIEGLEAQPKK